MQNVDSGQSRKYNGDVRSLVCLEESYAEEEYEDLLEINFEETPSAMEIFSGDLSVESMCTAIQFRYPQLIMKPGKTHRS